MNQQLMSTERKPEDLHGPLTVGSRLRKYEIQALIGQGGYASVYRAYDTLVQREVAIKVVHRIGGATEDMMRRGQAEASFLCSVRHPNIVEVFDADITDNGLLYIVMEYLAGRSLYDVLREHRRLAVEEALSLAVQVADAVQTAHRLGAIHRDLKPENIFVSANNCAKVLDFGIAKFINDVGAKTTAKDAIQGSVLYMSPEHVQGIKVGPRTDIYSLGIVLYQAMLGQHPVLLDMEDHATAVAVATWHVHRNPRPLCDLAPWVPSYVSRWVSSACAKIPARRPESMADFGMQAKTLLDRFLKETQGELQGRVRNLSLPTRALEAAPIPVVPDTSPEVMNFDSTTRTTAQAEQGPAGPAVARAPASTPPPRATPQRTALTTGWLAAAAISVALVLGGLTKYYLLHQRSAALPSVPSAIAVTEPTANHADGPVVQTKKIEGTVAAVPLPSASATAVAEPSARAVSSAKVAGRPKQATSSDLRLKALEDELARRKRAKEAAPKNSVPMLYTEEP